MLLEYVLAGCTTRQVVLLAVLAGQAWQCCATELKDKLWHGMTQDRCSCTKAKYCLHTRVCIIVKAICVRCKAQQVANLQ